MNTLDQAIVELIRKGLVTPEEGRLKSKDPSEFDRLMEVYRPKDDGPDHSGQRATVPPSAPPPAGPAAQAPIPEPEPTPPPAHAPPPTPPPGPSKPPVNRPNFGR